MRTLLLALALSIALPACGSHVPANLTPQGRAAYTADEVAKRIGEVQQLAIDGSDAGKIKVADARVIVTWTRATLVALRETPNGWTAAAVKTWPDVRKVIAANPSLTAYVPMIDGMLGYTQP